MRQALSELQTIYREKYAAGGTELTDWQKRKTDIDTEANQLRSEMKFIDAELAERASFKSAYESRLVELRDELDALPVTAVLRKKQLSDRIRELKEQPQNHLDRVTEKIHRRAEIEGRLSELSGEMKEMQKELKGITQRRTETEKEIRKLQKILGADPVQKVQKQAMKITPRIR